jgi:hypothetical protein
MGVSAGLGWAVALSRPSVRLCSYPDPFVHDVHFRDLIYLLTLPSYESGCRNNDPSSFWYVFLLVYALFSFANVLGFL